MFADIKEGDIVIVHTWNSSIVTEHHYELSKVTKVNKKTFKVEKYPTMLFTICRGAVYGGSGWERVNIFKYDEETYKKNVSQAKEAANKDIEKLKGLTSQRGGNAQKFGLQGE